MFFAGVFISLIVVVAAVLITQLELLVPVHAALSPYLPPEYRVKRKPRIVRHSFQPKDVPPPAPAFEPYVPEPAPPRACTLKKYSSDVVTPEAMADLTSNWTRCFVMNGIVDK
ncbi:hypothetical protein TrLO_g11546 [Triparma laevis f. longispina]|uniref:Uncharacterized protein n=1 Tax=Triparma laevis f. longispina TaxID=1714387 RepID=A0A9W7CFJ7_9STRA|nr:hypothetical protein TrLO_g11546 [Triparma laevis f. longispina]